MQPCIAGMRGTRFARKALDSPFDGGWPDGPPDRRPSHPSLPAHYSQVDLARFPGAKEVLLAAARATLTPSIGQLYAQLQASAPLDAHQALVAKHAMLQVRGACLPAWHAAPAAAAAHAARILQRACAPHSTCLHGRPAAVELALACR